MEAVLLLPSGNIENKLMEAILAGVKEELKVEVEILKKEIFIDSAFNETRNQYAGERLLNTFLRLELENKFLAVIDEDVYVNRLNFIFGLAELGRGAFISLKRLKPEFYGEKADEKIFTERAVKEAVHELGHVFGLVHCPNVLCVMCFSNSIFDVDIKGKSLCRRCGGNLKL